MVTLCLIMLRRFLACLALLTGLVAVGTPAQASAAAIFGAAVEQTQRADDGSKAGETSCAQRQREQRQRGERVRPCRAPETVTIVIPRVQFGPDRAFE